MVTKEEREVREAARRVVQNGLRGSGMTLRQFSKYVSVPESTLSRINNGALPSAAVAVKLLLDGEERLDAAIAARDRRAEPEAEIAAILKRVPKKDRLQVYARAGILAA